MAADHNPRRRWKIARILGIGAAVLVVIAGVVVVGVLALLVFAIAKGEEQRRDERDRVVAAYLAARAGTPQAVIKRRLGEPYAQKTMRTHGRSARCWIYSVSDAEAESSDVRFTFCFVHNRLVPPPEPTEPNEDIYYVKPGGLLGSRGQQPLTRPPTRRAAVNGRLAGHDSEDVYRAILPVDRPLEVRLAPDADVDLEVWDARTRSVFAEGADRRRHLVAKSHTDGRAIEAVVLTRAHSRGPIVYVDVYLPEPGPRRATYRLVARSL